MGACDCQECAALPAAEDNLGVSETVATFEQDGSIYEVDHLGISDPGQWGEFDVYRDGKCVAGFTVPLPALRPAGGAEDLPADVEELIRLARQAVNGDPPSVLPDAA
jgi:hypothetical protein